MNIQSVWTITLRHLETFTQDLERVRSFAALQGVKPLWRILKSIQLRYIPTLDEETEVTLSRALTRLDVRDVAPSDFTELEAIDVMMRFGSTCALDDIEELEETENN